MQASFHFKTLDSNWVALHPDPKGVVQFLGGSFFGTIPKPSSPLVGLSLWDPSPMVSYYYLLKQIFESGYTVVILPHWLAFDHWVVAEELLKNQQKLPERLFTEAEKLNYNSSIYQNCQSYLWAGHSLGCKYIALLRFLSQQRHHRRDSNRNESYFPIEDQLALFIAPCFKPPTAIAAFIRPSQEGTRRMLVDTSPQAPIAMISFHQDFISGNLTYQLGDVYWLAQQLCDRDENGSIHEEILGDHEEPIGYDSGNRDLAELTVRVLDTLKNTHNRTNRNFAQKRG
jgi:hypothetical protein